MCRVSHVCLGYCLVEADSFGGYDRNGFLPVNLHPNCPCRSYRRRPIADALFTQSHVSCNSDAVQLHRARRICILVAAIGSIDGSAHDAAAAADDCPAACLFWWLLSSVLLLTNAATKAADAPPRGAAAAWERCRWAPLLQALPGNSPDWMVLPQNESKFCATGACDRRRSRLLLADEADALLHTAYRCLVPCRRRLLRPGIIPFANVPFCS